MNKILLFHRDKAGNDTLNCFTELLGKALNRTGIETKVFDIEPYGTGRMPDGEVLYKEIVNAGFDAAIAFNSVGQEKYSIDGKNVFDMAGFPYINYIVDHPLDHFFSLTNVPKEYYVICMDREHVDFIKSVIPEVKDAFFLPLGGVIDESGIKEKKYDVVFTASLLDRNVIEQKILEMSGTLQKITLDTIDYLLFNRDASVEEGLLSVLEDKGLHCDNANDYLAYSFATKEIYKYLRSYYREECVRYIMQSDVELHIFGGGWERIISDNSSKVIIHDTIPYYDTARLTSESKVLLNIMPLFKDGSHDRIATAMLNGAAVLTDHSKYLDENYSEYLDFFDINHPEDIPNQIDYIIKHYDEHQFKIESAKKYAHRYMSWDCVAERIIDICNMM